MSGMHLEEIKSENLNIQNENPKLNWYKNINNKYPIKMKGEFSE